MESLSEKDAEGHIWVTIKNLDDHITLENEKNKGRDVLVLMMIINVQAHLLNEKLIYEQDKINIII